MPTGMSGLYKNTKGARMARGEKLTNFEKIKSMSIEEMAEFIENEDNVFQFCRKEYCYYHKENGDCEAFKNGIKGGCVEAAIKWLKSEIAESEELSNE